MKKSIIILSFGMMAAAFNSCGKNEKPDVLIEENTTETALTEMPAEMATANPQDEMLKKAQSHPLTNLVLSENHFDFKEVKKGESVEHIYEVTNTGENPLIISEVKPGCGCTAPNFTKTPILPGQKGQITLKFDSASFDGPQNKQAEVYANVENAPIILSFSANVIN